jgi:hypothetical protein
VLAIYSYQAGGPAQWYLAAGAVTNNVFTATLDRYTGGQCISCAFTGKPTLAGNDGTITVRFTSSTTATVNLPNGRVTQISPFVSRTRERGAGEFARWRVEQPQRGRG